MERSPLVLALRASGILCAATALLLTGHLAIADQSAASVFDIAKTLSRQSDRPGDRAIAAGKAAARCRRQMGACRRSEPDGADTRTRAAHVAPVPLAARSYSAQPSSVERPLRRHDHRCRIGIQPLAQSRRIALARRRHLRSLGVVCLSARCRKRFCLVCGLSAERRQAGQL